MRGRGIRDHDVKPAYPRQTIAPKHQRPARSVRRAPDVQVARGPTTSETYLKLRRAYKKHTAVQYQQRWYYVAALKIDAGMFEAKLVEAV